VDNKWSVSFIAEYSSSANKTTVPAPLRVIVIGSRSRTADSIRVDNRLRASV
jgi:hypothetical protein